MTRRIAGYWLMVLLILGTAAVLLAAEKGHDHNGRQGQHGHKSESLPSAVTGEGKIIAVVPASEQVVVDHKAIEGFMDAMTMGYKVNPTSLLDGIQAGDQVRFTIDTQKKTIVRIEKMN